MMTQQKSNTMSIRKQVTQTVTEKTHGSKSAIVDATITAFLKAAAKQGRHMVPDEATPAMIEVGIRCAHGQGMITSGPDSAFQLVWRAMVAEADKFEWE